MGTALRNMDNLLHMPYGCGEQNMALFTPNIYALDYLNKTGQLTEEIRLRGTGYLSTGKKFSDSSIFFPREMVTGPSLTEFKHHLDNSVRQMV